MRKLQLAIALAAGLVVVTAAAQTPPAEAPSYLLWEFGTVPRPAFKQVLLQQPAVQEELGLTKDQQKRMEDTYRQQSTRIRAAQRAAADRQKFLAAREALLKEMMAAIQDVLDPNQRERLDQIQLQSQGPMAFNRSQAPMLVAEGPDLAQRLKLSDDQAQRARDIAEKGQAEIEKAASVPIALDPRAGAPTIESLRNLAATAEFKAAKRKVREEARRAWTAVIERIEGVLTEPQRQSYRAMLGAPFDLSKIRFGGDEAEEDASSIAGALGVGGGGQQADPTFDTRVARPAYASKHPRVLFDEAHHNFHTTGGRYKPFAQLIANDGYEVIPNKERLTRETLGKGEILIIANALGAEGMGQAGAGNSAFTEAECDAVRDWVQAGGSLLLITDHAPFGSAAQSLARRFGVDMSKGYTSDPVNSEGGETSLVFSRKNQLLVDHPITEGRDESERLDRVRTFTGQSLKGPDGSVAFLKLADTAFDEGDDGKPASAKGRAQGLAFKLGEGRVVVLGEAAELSAQRIGAERFGMNVPGLDNRKMALNIMHWLSGLLEPRTEARRKAG
jgi:hypothetical protein